MSPALSALASRLKQCWPSSFSSRKTLNQWAVSIEVTQGGLLRRLDDMNVPYEVFSYTAQRYFCTKKNLVLVSVTELGLHNGVKALGQRLTERVNVVGLCSR